MSFCERLAQRIRYFPWWVRHPIQYHHSERIRRAINLVGDMVTEGVELWERDLRLSVDYEKDDRWDMFIVMERRQ